MRSILFLLCAVFCLGITLTFAQQKEVKPAPSADAGNAPIPAEDASKKNPVTLTPEGFGAAKKLFGYHCAMCHGENGNGQGDLATQMKLDLHDWRDPATLAKFTDGELFYIITNGRGKMTGGEGDRTKEETRWNLVSVVRSFVDKKAVAAATAKP
jgi:mono/diheme cytochrome c family protein